MATISTLVVALTATTSDFERGLEKASRQLDRFAGRFEDIGSKLALGVTAPLVALAEESVRFAVEFSEGFEKMGATLGQTKGQVDQMRQAVLQLATGTAQGPRELAQDLNSIETAGLRGQAALDVLRVSAKAATIGLGDLHTVSATLTAALNAYGPQTLSAAQATSVLLAAVREGRISGDEFMGSITAILPLASNLGVSLDQVAAAMAVMTKNGLDAGQAMGALRSIFTSLEKPSSSTSQALGEMGLTARGLRDELQSKGLLAVLQTLAQGFKTNDEALVKVFPNARALGGVLSLLGANGKQAEAVFRGLAGTTGDTLNKAFAAVAEGPGFKFKQALTELQVLLIRLGDDLLPKLMPLVTAFAGGLERAAGFVERLSPAQQAWVIGLAATAAALGPVLLGFAAFYNALSTVAGGLALAWRVGSIVLGGFVNGLTMLMAAFNQIAVVFEALEPVLLAAFGAITGPGLIAFGLFAGAAILIASRWQELKTDLGVIFQWIADEVRGTFVGKIIDYLGRFAAYAADLLSKFGVTIQGFVQPAWAGLVDGVTNATTAAKTSLSNGLAGMLAQARQFAASFSATMGQAAGRMPQPTTAGPEGGGMSWLPKPTSADKSAWDTFADSVKQDAQAVNSAFGQMAADMKDNTAAYNQQASQLTAGTERSMGAMTAAFAQGKLSLNDFVKDMIQAIELLIIKILLLKALTQAGLGGNFAAGFVGGIGGGPLGFADGGRPPVGRVSVVGERGPELFMPDTAGTIVPLDGRMAGGPQVHIEQHVHIEGMDLGSHEAARRVATALKEHMRAGSAEGTALALQSAQTATKYNGRAV